MMDRLTLVKRILGLAVLIVALGFPLIVTQPTMVNFAILILMAAQLGVAWNILGGYAGQVSLGHAVFYGIGAYTSSVLAAKFGLSPWLGMLAGGAIASGFALLIGWPCFRLKGHYFAMATLAIAAIVEVLVTNWDYVEGAIGIYLPMTNSGWAGMVFTRSKTPYFYIALGLLLLSLLVSRILQKSYIGYYFRAIKEDPDAARSLGINLARYKLVAIAASAFLTAMGGTLYAQKELFIDPGSVLAGSLSIKIALIAILGGVGTLFGPVVGALVLIAIEEFTRQIFGSTGMGTDMIIYGGIIVIIAMFSPGGIAGLLGEWERAWRARRKLVYTPPGDGI
ncbi:branched-chain amino acid ABC transporter permease [Telmatospirillum siberiense]|uniref:Branched-chain amino acid ABC transporter permease n=1 Tax=Telmatospirillum siberiense TaxID=382514 RepID=A0A2N3PT53_9PROT|nr:branched-chain amino acid ABC transporter permease [Telmatospirillum siberiense]PKU23588.1 branched-chain amino acid ABC transporter permease [Telmatospirillum siberiense]